VIKSVALGVVCLAGLGAIATVGKKPTLLPVPDVAMPVVAGNKADRLPIRPQQTILANAHAADIVYVPSAEEEEPITSPQSASEEAVRPPSHDVAPRYSPTSHNHKSKAAKRKVRSPRQAKKQLVEEPPKPLTEVKVECRSDGLQPLLAKLNLPCITVQR
jgi:hypothetical protein